MNLSLSNGKALGRRFNSQPTTPRCQPQLPDQGHDHREPDTLTCGVSARVTVLRTLPPEMHSHQHFLRPVPKCRMPASAWSGGQFSKLRGSVSSDDKFVRLPPLGHDCPLLQSSAQRRDPVAQGTDPHPPETADNQQNQSISRGKIRTYPSRCRMRS